MAKPYLSLQPSELAVAQSAATIYAAYVAAGRVPEGKENDWIRKSIGEAFTIARLTDESMHSDDEMG
jgi:hypothetical protein